jgi:hypothetical protein
MSERRGNCSDRILRAAREIAREYGVGDAELSGVLYGLSFYVANSAFGVGSASALFSLNATESKPTTPPEPPAT